jgi:hypothetical protein
MCVIKLHAFIYFLRPPPWSGTTRNSFSVSILQYNWIQLFSFYPSVQLDTAFQFLSYSTTGYSFSVSILHLNTNSMLQLNITIHFLSCHWIQLFSLSCNFRFLPVTKHNFYAVSALSIITMLQWTQQYSLSCKWTQIHILLCNWTHLFSSFILMILQLNANLIFYPATKLSSVNKLELNTTI